MIENNIKSEITLFAIADEQKKAVKKDLANFVLSRSTKAISDLLENTKKIRVYKQNVFNSKQTCMKVIHEYSHSAKCKDSCTVATIFIYRPYFSTAALIVN